MHTKGVITDVQLYSPRAEFTIYPRWAIREKQGRGGAGSKGIVGGARVEEGGAGEGTGRPMKNGIV